MPHRPPRPARRPLPRILAGSSVACALLLAATSACHGAPPAPEKVIASNIADLHATIAKEVADPEKVKLLDQQVDRLSGLLLELSASTRSFAHDMRLANSRFDSTAAELQQVFDRFEADRLRIRNEVVDVHFAMLAQTSASEWERLNRHEREAIKAAGSTHVTAQ